MIRITAKNIMWAEKAAQLQDQGVNNERDMVLALNAEKNLSHPRDLLRSAIKGGFEWNSSRVEPLVNLDIQAYRAASKTKTALKREHIAKIAEEFRDKKITLIGHSTSVFFSHFKTFLINKDKREGTNYIGKKCSTSALEAQVVAGGFVR